MLALRFKPRRQRKPFKTPTSTLSTLPSLLHCRLPDSAVMAPVQRLAPSIRATIRGLPSAPASSIPPTHMASNIAASTRHLSVTPLRRSDDSHGSHYDAPSGWLWGVPPGQKAEKEGWEGIWTYGFYGTIALGVIAYAFKPDSRFVLLHHTGSAIDLTNILHSIETWALEEAKRRLQAEGTLPEDK